MKTLEELKKLPTHEILHETYYASNNPDSDSLYANVDLALENRFRNLKAVYDADWIFGSRPYLSQKLPKTFDQINKTIDNAIDTDIDGFNWSFVNRNFSGWINEELKTKIIKLWIEEKTGGIYGFNPDEDEVFSRIDSLGVDILKRYVKIYLVSKSSYNLKRVGTVFSKMPEDRLEEACGLLASSTPAVASCLLKRESIPEKYIPKALKSIGKLLTQKEVKLKIDFSKLTKLGPKERLAVMKQLLGTMDGYYKNYKRNVEYYKNCQYYTPEDRLRLVQRETDSYNTYGINKDFPFNPVPSKDDVEAFLFPCSLKFNDEVNEIVKRYKEKLDAMNNQSTQTNEPSAQ